MTTGPNVPGGGGQATPPPPGSQPAGAAQRNAQGPPGSEQQLDDIRAVRETQENAARIRTMQESIVRRVNEVLHNNNIQSLDNLRLKQHFHTVGGNIVQMKNTLNFAEFQGALTDLLQAKLLAAPITAETQRVRNSIIVLLGEEHTLFTAAEQQAHNVAQTNQQTANQGTAQPQQPQTPPPGQPTTSSSPSEPSKTRWQKVKDTLGRGADTWGRGADGASKILTNNFFSHFNIFHSNFWGRWNRPKGH